MFGGKLTEYVGVLLLAWLVIVTTLGLTDSGVATLPVGTARLYLIAAGLLLFGESFIRRLIELRYGYRPAGQSGDSCEGERATNDNDEEKDNE